MARPILPILLVLAAAVTASLAAAPPGAAEGGDPGSGPPVPGRIDPYKALDFGVALQLDRPQHLPGEAARATLFFFNLTPMDADGALANFGGLGCRYHVFVRNQAGRLVWRPFTICPRGSGEPGVAPMMPFPFPGGTLLQYPVDLSMAYQFSDTYDPDGEPLPGGPYTLEARHDYHGPVMPVSETGGWGDGGEPRAEVPFRIVVCDGSTGPMPVRDLGRTLLSGWRFMEPGYQGEDLVLRTAEAGLAYWVEHTFHVVPMPPPPEVDFRREMALVSLLGGRGTRVEILSVEEHRCHILVRVRDHLLPPGDQARVNTFHAVAVPRSLKEVIFVHSAVFE